MKELLLVCNYEKTLDFCEICSNLSLSYLSYNQMSPIINHPNSNETDESNLLAKVMLKHAQVKLLTLQKLCDAQYKLYCCLEKEPLPEILSDETLEMAKIVEKANDEYENVQNEYYNAYYSLEEEFKSSMTLPYMRDVLNRRLGPNFAKDLCKTQTYIS